MKLRTPAALATGACLAFGMAAALAGDISSIQPSASTVSLQGGKAVVNFAVGGTAAGNESCGYFVEYGDGSNGDSRVISRTNGQFVRQHQRTFDRPGTYTIEASGRRHKTTQACYGQVSTVVTVVAAAAAAAWTPPACPEGWALNERSVNRRTGAFYCTAKPAVELECGDGLRYYERDGIIGCRENRRSREDRRDRDDRRG